MDKKLTIIDELINEVKKSLVGLKQEQIFQATILADNIIQKLINLRNLCNNGSLNIATNEYYDLILMNNDRQQRLTHNGNIHAVQLNNRKTEILLNDDETNLVQIAHLAYNNENYAKCVRTVEKIATLQRDKLNPILMDLCHKSYKKVIQSAGSNTDRLKLCEWWKLFVESTTLDDPSNEALLCQIDWRSECLQERLKLTRCVNERMKISELLIANLIEAYEIASKCMATFSVAKLRQRIDELCSMIADYLRNFPQFNKVSLVIEEGIELLRFIHNEAKDEFNVTVQNKNRNEGDRKNLLAIMDETNLILQHCSWCDVSFFDKGESKSKNTAAECINSSKTADRNNTSANELALFDDIIEARF